MRIHKNIGVAIVTIGLSLTLGATAPANASAPVDTTSVAATEERDNAKKMVRPVTVDKCNSVGVYEGCFKKYGDYFFVWDGSPDLMSGYVLWQNHLRKSNGTWTAYRNGRCEFGDYGNWGGCNKNFYEHSTSPNAAGGKGSRIRIKTCQNIPASPDPCSGWSSWVLNNG